MSSIRGVDLLIIVVYMAALVVVGIRFSARQTSTERYFVGKRNIPSWAMGLSLFATLITSVSFIAFPGAAYAGDWSNLTPEFMLVIVLLAVGAIVIPFFRQVVHMTAYEYFGRRFGYAARVYSSLAFSLAHFSKMAFIFYLLGLTVSSMTGWNTDRVIVAVGAIIVCYTLIGGIEAVIWADVIQGFVLWLGVFVCLGSLLALAPGGPLAALNLALQYHKIGLGSMALDLTRPTFVVFSLYGFFYYLQRYTTDQTIVQRYLVAADDRAALRGIGLAAVLSVPVWALFMLIGTLSWAFYKSAGEGLPAQVARPDQVLPWFVTTHVPPGLAGLFLAALFGAAMANVSSDLNSLSTVAVSDYYRVLRPSSTDRERLRAAKLIVAVCGVACIGIGIRLAHSTGPALSLWYGISAAVAGGLAGLFLLAFLVERAGREAAWAGIAANVSFVAWATLTSGGGRTWDLGQFNFPLHPYMVGVIGHIVLLAVGSAASLVFCNRDPEARALTLWGWLERAAARKWTRGSRSLPRAGKLGARSATTESGPTASG